FKDYFIQWIPEATLTFQPIPTMLLVARADYVLGDYNEADMSLRVKFSQVLGKMTKNLGTISITGDYVLQKPGWFYESYLGNNFIWETAWEKQGLISAGFNYSWKFIETGVQLNRITNYVYLDTGSIPNQYKGSFSHIYAYLNTNLDLWRFNITAKLAYQTIQGTTVMRVPAFMGSLAVYYSQPLFHGAAVLQPGLSFFYNTSYYADGYMPATRSFHIQDAREIGNYLYMDVFINLKVQRARLFVMYSHFNASFMGKSYYMVPGYPMPDGAFKFGVSWRFHD
ncbi:MAG: putative porin, partial [bacterium]